MASGPAKYSKEVEARVCRALLLGASYRTASRAGGISEDTFAIWRKRGQEGKGGKAAESYRSFYEATEHAITQCQLNQLSRIEQAAPDDWRAAAWKLERRFPDEFAPVNRTELTGKGGGALTVDATHTGSLEVDPSAEALEVIGELFAIMHLPKGEGIIGVDSIDTSGDDG